MDEKEQTLSWTLVYRSSSLKEKGTVLVKGKYCYVFGVKKQRGSVLVNGDGEKDFASCR